MDWREIIERVAVTFVEGFMGVFIPALCIYLNSGWPESWGSAWVAIAPILSGAIAAGLSAAWNYWKQFRNIPDD